MTRLWPYVVVTATLVTVFGLLLSVAHYGGW